MVRAGDGRGNRCRSIEKNLTYCHPVAQRYRAGNLLSPGRKQLLADKAGFGMTRLKISVVGRYRIRQTTTVLF